jgi:hypothetical protein
MTILKHRGDEAPNRIQSNGTTGSRVCRAITKLDGARLADQALNARNVRSDESGKTVIPCEKKGQQTEAGRPVPG